MKAGRQIKWFLVTAAAVLVGCSLCITVYFWFDEVLNGYLLDWFEQRFMFYKQKIGPGGVVTYYREIRWDPLKRLVFDALLLLVTAWIVSVRLISAAYASYQERRKVRQIGQMIGSYMSPRKQFGAMDAAEVFPEEYVEISAQLAEVKADMQLHEQMLKEEAARKNDLITYLAHDLKTPLTSVVGYLSLLEEAPDMPPEQKAKYVHIALDKAFRLEKLINEFFEITRYNLQQIVLEKETVDLEFMLVQMADEFYPILQEHGNTVRLCFGGRKWGGQGADAGDGAVREQVGDAGNCAAREQGGDTGNGVAREQGGDAENCAAREQGGDTGNCAVREQGGDAGNGTATENGRTIQVYADSEKLARVFNNILKNAVAYSYPGTEITIEINRIKINRTKINRIKINRIETNRIRNQQDPKKETQAGASAEQEKVTVAFSNHGKTIPRQRLDSIFEKFFRLDEARTTDTGGAGLGLAIAKEIVTLHGGTITARSENEVTVFTVELPAQG